MAKIPKITSGNTNRPNGNPLPQWPPTTWTICSELAACWIPSFTPAWYAPTPTRMPAATKSSATPSHSPRRISLLLVPRRSSLPNPMLGSRCEGAVKAPRRVLAAGWRVRAVATDGRPYTAARVRVLAVRAPRRPVVVRRRSRDLRGDRHAPAEGTRTRPDVRAPRRFGLRPGGDVRRDAAPRRRGNRRRDD